jgi:hypothetical protein
MSGGLKLADKQEEAIAALVAQPTAKAAAELVGVDEHTITRWKRDPSFARAYQEARERIFVETVEALAGASVQAVQALVNVARGEHVPPEQKIEAATRLLEFIMRGMDGAVSKEAWYAKRTVMEHRGLFE